jgi:hypothetical protein
MDASTPNTGSTVAMWAAFAVTFACVLVALAAGHAAAFVLLLLGILVLGPWTAGFVTGQRLASTPTPTSEDVAARASIGRSVASIALALVLTAALSVIGIGLFLGAAISTTMGATAAAGLGLRAGLGIGWRASREHWLDASITLLAWLGSLGSLVAFGTDGHIGAWLLTALGCAVSVAAATRRWSTRIARAAARASLGHSSKLDDARS